MKDREEIRLNAGKNLPSKPFVIKSLRADNLSFYRDFIKIITTGESKPLRKGPKKIWTVTGKGVFQRNSNLPLQAPLKQPQYSHEQKMGYSKAQSASLGTQEYSPTVFGITAERKSILTGVYIEVDSNVLFSDRNYIYDGGTVTRPYDFDSFNDA